MAIYQIPETEIEKAEKFLIDPKTETTKGLYESFDSQREMELVHDLAKRAEVPIAFAWWYIHRHNSDFLEAIRFWHKDSPAAQERAKGASALWLANAYAYKQKNKRRAFASIVKKHKPEWEHYMEAYCSEAEEQHGKNFWAMADNLPQLILDFKVYVEMCKEMEADATKEMALPD